jgi:hypothetical protein
VQASRQRVGVLVIRVWEEAGSGLRARLTQSVDVGASDSEVTVEKTAATQDAILEAVQSWLEAFLSSER